YLRFHRAPDGRCARLRWQSARYAQPGADEPAGVATPYGGAGRHALRRRQDSVDVRDRVRPRFPAGAAHDVERRGDHSFRFAKEIRASFSSADASAVLLQCAKRMREDDTKQAKSGAKPRVARAGAQDFLCLISLTIQTYTSTVLRDIDMVGAVRSGGAR